jgi:hypothetical protein
MITNAIGNEVLTVLQSTLSLLSVVVSEWKAREEEKKRKEEIEAQAVKYKVKTHTMETQEEIDEAKFRAAFPDYFKLYSDLDVRNSPYEYGLLN